MREFVALNEFTDGQDSHPGMLESIIRPVLDTLRCTKAPQGLRIDPRRLMSKLLHVLNVRPRINSGIAVRAALAAQFQHT